jgi:hydrogenase maturation protease
MIPTSARDDVLILGIGNPLMGDDGVGIRTAEIIAEKNLPEGVTVQEAGLPGWGLPSWLEGRSSVILVDAVQMGAAPGEWKRFHPKDLRVVLEDGSLSLHEPGLAAGLALTEALNMLPENLTLYGVQPAQTNTGDGLSAEVSACLPNLVQAILDDLSAA